VNSKSTPIVSVIVPNYNHARFLRRRLDSILGQTFQDFELILLDDCSTDESRSILSEYASYGVRIEFNNRNSGSTFKQWNKGVTLARGKYVWIAESDDYADERLLEKLVSRLDAYEDIAFCYCRSRWVSDQGEVSGFLDAYLSELHPHKWTADFLVDGREECEKWLIYCNTITGTSSVLFRRDVYQKMGGADERLVYCGDWKAWAAMCLMGGRISYLAEPLNFQRFHQDSVTTNSQHSGVDADEYLQVIRWISQRVATTEATRQKLCHNLFPLWTPKALSRRTPLRRRWAIVRNARAIDRDAFRKLVQAALVTVRNKISHYWQER
jgi:hypothetical protein